MKHIIFSLLIACSSLVNAAPDYVCQRDYETRIVKHKPKRLLSIKARKQVNAMRSNLLRRSRAAAEEVDFIVYTGVATINGIFDMGGTISGIYFSKSESYFKEIYAEDVIEVENTYIDFIKDNNVYRSYFFIETPGKKARDRAEKKKRRRK